MNSLEMLVAARELISYETKWTQGRFARDKEGDWTPAVSDKAHCFCALGALYKVSGEPEIHLESPELRVAINSLHNLARKYSYESATSYNDNTNHTKVLALFDTVIELSKTESL